MVCTVTTKAVQSEPSLLRSRSLSVIYEEFAWCVSSALKTSDQDSPRTELELAAVSFPETESRTGTARAFLEELRMGLELHLSMKLWGQLLSLEEQSEPKIRTTRTIAFTNSNWIEPTRGHTGHWNMYQNLLWFIASLFAMNLPQSEKCWLVNPTCWLCDMALSHVTMELFVRGLAWEWQTSLRLDASDRGVPQSRTAP